jgi:hypothetical protein
LLLEDDCGGKGGPSLTFSLLVAAAGAAGAFWSVVLLLVPVTSLSIVLALRLAAVAAGVDPSLLPGGAFRRGGMLAVYFRIATVK